MAANKRATKKATNKPTEQPKVQSEKSKVLPTPLSTDVFFPEEKQIIQNDLTDQFKLKMVEEVYSTTDVELKTDLNNAEIIAITKGKLFSKTFNTPIISELCLTLMELKISKDRKGRKEFVEIAKSLLTPTLEEQSSSIPQRLLGER
jgi:hypothetical protein